MSNGLLSTIPKQWLFTHGMGVKVGVIDSGFDVQNIYIKEHISEYIDLGSTNIDHGTHVTGIMCFNSPNNNVDCGLANKANYYLISIPIGKPNGIQKLEQAITLMNDYNIDVLNMSFTNYKDNVLFKETLYHLCNRGTILVGAYSQHIFYPHSYPFVIGAGFDLATHNAFNSTISNNRFKLISGTSMQSAFISSVAALAKSYDKKINNNLFLNQVSGNTMWYNKKIIRQKQYSIKIK